jgi:hypothetical protein
MCTTSIECKTSMTVVLTIKSRMDPHMIGGTWDGFLVKSLVGLCRSGFTRLSDAIEVVIFEEMSLLLLY